MTGNLDTTNVLLGIMAAVSVFEALLLIGVGIGAVIVYRRLMQIIADLEARQIAPLRERVDAILMDVKSVTARVSYQTERVDQVISGTMERVDDTAQRVTGSVRDKVNHVVGVVRGVRAALMALLGVEHGHEPPATAAGRL
jgi:uncharacterized membrane protein